MKCILASCMQNSATVCPLRWSTNVPVSFAHHVFCFYLHPMLTATNNIYHLGITMHQYCIFCHTSVRLIRVFATSNIQVHQKGFQNRVDINLLSTVKKNSPSTSHQLPCTKMTWLLVSLRNSFHSYFGNSL